MPEWNGTERWYGLSVEAWRVDYNQQRPHSSLAYRTPEEFAQLIRDEVARWSKVIRTAGIKLE